MATPAEYTIGTNAAMPSAQADIDRMAGPWASQIPLADVQQLVADVVVASLNAVDAYRAANPHQLKETPMPNTGISPTAAMWLNVAFLILTGIGAGTLLFPGVSDTVVTMIKGYSADAAFIISAINVVFHAYSTPAGGPMLRR